VGDDQVTVVDGQFGHELRLVAAVDQALRFGDHAEQR
jgi:hypothetical protein